MKTKWMRRILLLFSFAVIFAMVPSGMAQSRSVGVNRRDAKIFILSNGDVRVEETWEVAFSGSPEFTFAFRSIPLNISFNK